MTVHPPPAPDTTPTDSSTTDRAASGGEVAARTAYHQAYATATTTAVDALTAALALRSPTGDPVDFAGFLAHTLAAATANTGGIDRVLAGRAGSWEADLVHQLATGTMGPDLDDLAWWRTTPVIVTLNVAELVQERLDGTGLDAALEAVEARYDAQYPILGYSDADDDDDAVVAAREAEYDAVVRACDAELTATRTRYTTAYAAFAEAFTAAVHTHTTTALPGLGVPVTVTVDDDPLSGWWDRPDAVRNPDAYTSDPLAFRLWSAALAATLAATPIPDFPPLGEASTTTGVLTDLDQITGAPAVTAREDQS